MASSSNSVHEPGSSVAHFGPNCRPFRWEGGTKRWLLWPFWAFRVVVPIPEPERFNLLETFVLKASGAGARGSGRMAEVLRLEPELAEFLSERMKGGGFIDEYGALTERGRAALEEQETREPEMVTGQVFVDAISGQLWPRFADGALKNIEAWMKENSGAQFKPTAGDSIKTGFVVWPDHYGAQQEPAAPSSRGVAVACRRHARRRDNWRARRGEADGGGAAEMLEGLAWVDGARLVDARPEPVFVTTSLFMPENTNRSSLWQVCDPFGLGVSRRLRQTMADLIGDSGGSLKELVERVTDEAYAVDEAEVAEILQASHAEAVERVHASLGGDEEISGDLFAALVHLEEARGSVLSALEAGGESVAIAGDEARSCLRSAQRAVEAALQVVVEEFGGEVQENFLSDETESARSNASKLQTLAVDLGGEVSPEKTRGLLSVERSQVLGILNGRYRELSALLAAALLGAAVREEHPLHVVFAAFPEALTFLGCLQSQRGTAAHGSNREVELKELEQIAVQTYRFVSLLLRGKEPEALEAAPGNDASWDAQGMMRLRSQARRQVRERLDLGGQSRSGLVGYLTNMQMKVKALDLGGGSELAEGGRLVDLIVEGTSACEVALRELLAFWEYDEVDIEAFAEPEEWSSSARRLRVLAARLGFKLDREGSLPDALLGVNPRRLEHTLETGRGSLNSLTWSALIHGEVGHERAVRKFAKGHPKWLLHIGELSDRRGHGDEVRVSAEEAADIAEKVYTVVEAVLEAVDTLN